MKTNSDSLSHMPSIKIYPSFLSVFSGAIAGALRITTTRPSAASLGLLALVLLQLAPGRAHASRPYVPTNTKLQEQQLTSIAAAPNGGFWIQKDQWNSNRDRQDQEDGQTLSTAGAASFENVSKAGSIAAIPGRNGYWVVSWDGRIFNRGDAPLLCETYLDHCSGFPGGVPDDVERIVAAAARPQGDGLWAVSRKGQVWTAGNARSYGDVQHQSHPVTGIVATPSGNGYYIVAKDGGVFSFGDAVFWGSTGGTPPAQSAITGMALSVGYNGQVNGYWLVGEDGGVHTFGFAPFWGSTGGNDGGSPVTGIVSFPASAHGRPPEVTNGYAWVHRNGHVGKATEDEPR
jgi:hypothetical protein